MTGHETETISEGSAKDAASYLVDIVGELAEVARVNRLDVVAYLLDMARLEAATHAEAQRVRSRPRLTAR